MTTNDLIIYNFERFKVEVADFANIVNAMRVLNNSEKYALNVDQNDLDTVIEIPNYAVKTTKTYYIIKQNNLLVDYFETHWGNMYTLEHVNGKFYLCIYH